MGIDATIYIKFKKTLTGKDIKKISYNLVKCVGYKWFDFHVPIFRVVENKEDYGYILEWKTLYS